MGIMYNMTEHMELIIIIKKNFTDRGNVDSVS